VFLTLPASQMMKFYDAPQYEKLFFVCVGVMITLGLYLTISAFNA
jgi:hypothetical protein